MRWAPQGSTLDCSPFRDFMTTIRYRPCFVMLKSLAVEPSARPSLARPCAASHPVVARAPRTRFTALRLAWRLSSDRESVRFPRVLDLALTLG